MFTDEAKVLSSFHDAVIESMEFDSERATLILSVWITQLIDYKGIARTLRFVFQFEGVTLFLAAAGDELANRNWIADALKAEIESCDAKSGIEAWTAFQSLVNSEHMEVWSADLVNVDDVTGCLMQGQVDDWSEVFFTATDYSISRSDHVPWDRLQYVALWHEFAAYIDELYAKSDTATAAAEN